MKAGVEGRAIVYCEGNFNTPNGKTAHGLVRFTERYQVMAVIDSVYSGRDAGMVLDGKACGIPVVADLASGLEFAAQNGQTATHFVIGLAPDGGRLPVAARQVVRQALEYGLHVDSGLHDFLSDDPDLMTVAQRRNVRIRDIRKIPDRRYLHFFSGKIEQVDSCKIVVLGTDSAIGKRTTAWILVHAFRAMGTSVEFVGTGQTAWMQGARYSLILDSLINDFLSGEIEHAVWQAWYDNHPDVIIIEGQGSLMNPAYPGGYELLAAGRPNLVILQHAPARKEYDGFPGYALHPLPKQIKAIEMISGKPIVAVTINHENLNDEQINEAFRSIKQELGLPAFDVLRDGAEQLVTYLLPLVRK